MLAEHVDGDAADDDPLAMLHTSAAGQREPGFLRAWAGAGGAGEKDAPGAPSPPPPGSDFAYSPALDEATRYGCGVFNRVWKASPLRSAFLAAYERFVADVIAPLLHSEADGLVYQAVPVFRVFMPGHLGVGPRHTDAQYHAQPNEINVWVPLTRAFGSNSLQVESRPGAADFSPITCEYGGFFCFRGNACEHFTALNVEGRTRVSFDFRVICARELDAAPVPTAPPPERDTARGKAAHFTIGEGRYYARLPGRGAAAAAAAADDVSNVDGVDLSGELWLPEHRPVHEATAGLVLRGVLSASEVDMLLRAPGPMYPPRNHRMLRGTTTGPAAVHDVALGTAHTVLYLHRGMHFQTEWPDLAARLTGVMRSQPGYPCNYPCVEEAEEEPMATPRASLQLRCAEFHTYTAGGGLLAAGHRDRGSVLSMAMLLSDPSQCEGGEFVTWGEQQQPQVHALGRGDAILFHSEKTHNVKTVTSGVRHSLVLELWKGRENEFDRNR